MFNILKIYPTLQPQVSFFSLRLFGHLSHNSIKTHQNSIR